MTKIVRILASVGLLLGLSFAPAYAQSDTTNPGGGQAVAACNRTAKDSLKSVRDSFKAGSITKDERNTKVKEAETARRSCVKSAREAAKTARDVNRVEMKAKAETARAEAKAKREAAMSEAKAKREAAKAELKTKKEATRAERKAGKTAPAR